MSRLSTWFSTGKKTSVDETTTLLEDLAKLRLRVKRLEITHEELQAQHDSLVTQLRTVRGMITGGMRRPQESPAGVAAIPFGDKESLRAHVGLAVVKKQPTGE